MSESKFRPFIWSQKSSAPLAANRFKEAICGNKYLIQLKLHETHTKCKADGFYLTNSNTLQVTLTDLLALLSFLLIVYCFFFKSNLLLHQTLNLYAQPWSEMDPVPRSFCPVCDPKLVVLAGAVMLDSVILLYSSVKTLNCQMGKPVGIRL